jgi:hypothetical protein
MSAELEKKVKPSYKLDVEDFHPFPFGHHNYYKRNKDLNVKFDEYQKIRVRTFGLLAFNIAMFSGIIYLDRYLSGLFK